MINRICGFCGKIKLIEEFSKKKNGKYYKSCDKCREIQKQWREQNKDVISEKAKIWREQNKDVISERNKKYYERNKNVISKKIKIYHKEYNVLYSLYDNIYNKLNTYEECRQDPNDITLLQVKCTKCGEWFNPTNSMVRNRLQSINGTGAGENRFYCSDTCKDSCEIYNRISWPKGLNPYSKREGSSKLRKIVLERDLQTCQKCYSKYNLECHHIVPIKIDKTLSNDPNNCITLCHECHMEAHSDYDCTTGYLANL